MPSAFDTNYINDFLRDAYERKGERRYLDDDYVNIIERLVNIVSDLQRRVKSLEARYPQDIPPAKILKQEFVTDTLDLSKPGTPLSLFK